MGPDDRSADVFVHIGVAQASGIDELREGDRTGVVWLSGSSDDRLCAWHKAPYEAVVIGGWSSALLQRRSVALAAVRGELNVLLVFLLRRGYNCRVFRRAGFDGYCEGGGGRRGASEIFFLRAQHVNFEHKPRVMGLSF